MPQRAQVEGLERVVGVRVRLDHIVGGHDGAAHDDHGPLPHQLRGCSRAHGVPQVRGTLVPGVTGGAHRADDDHGLWGVDQQVVCERGLLHDIGPLHHHRTLDVRPGEAGAHQCGDIQDLGETQMRGGDQPPVDGLHRCDGVQSGCAGQDGRAIQRWTRRTGDRIGQHRDGAPGEDDRDPGPGGHSSCPVLALEVPAATAGSAGPARPGTTGEAM